MNAKNKRVVQQLHASLPFPRNFSFGHYNSPSSWPLTLLKLFYVKNYESELGRNFLNYIYIHSSFVHLSKAQRRPTTSGEGQRRTQHIKVGRRTTALSLRQNIGNETTGAIIKHFVGVQSSESLIQDAKIFTSINNNSDKIKKKYFYVVFIANV